MPLGPASPERGIRVAPVLHPDERRPPADRGGRLQLRQLAREHRRPEVAAELAATAG